jgi:hypothetical protein
MFVPFSRIVTMLMSAVICFALLMPLSLQRHNWWLAIFIVVAFFGYLAANVVLWRRLKPRA